MNQRNYLIFDDALQDESVRPVFDRAVERVNDGTLRARGLNGDYPMGFVVDGQGILGTAVLEFGIGLVPAGEFDYEQARAFTERMRVLLGWNDIDYTLERWVERRLRDPYFENLGSDWNQDWQLRPDADTSHLPDAFFQFACYVAIGELKHGPSYASVSANRIFDWVAKLGSTLPARLKKHGTGELPAELAHFAGEGETAGVTAKANDALAVIRLTVKEEGEAAYATILDYLARLLETTDFPRSFSIEFRGPTKQHLPIAGLPKKGVNQLFACAAAYPALWPAIERYARAAMREDEWYDNLEDEHCAMPGSFAVFALGLASAAAGSGDYAPLVLDYLREVDGEHQELQARFVEAHLDAHGFTALGVAYLVACAGNIQHMRHRRAYPAMIANRESLEALLAVREAAAGGARGEASGIAALRANLEGVPVEGYAWRHALSAIWGDAAEQRDASGRVGANVIDAAPEGLRPLYERAFAAGTEGE